MRRSLSIAVMAAMLFTSLNGCASKYGEQRTAVQYYPACYRPIQDLRDRENTVSKGAGTGALVGALGGMLVGLLASDGKWQGAVTGAAVGGASGAIGGAMYARHQKEMDDNRRMAAYLQELNGDISNLDIAGAAARTSLQCYDRQFNALLAQIRARTVTRQAAAARYAEITSGREEAISILGRLVDNGRNLDQQYEQAFAGEEQKIGSPASTAQGRAAYRQKSGSLQSARARKSTLTRKTAALARERDDAQLASSRQTREINEAMANLENIRL